MNEFSFDPKQMEAIFRFENIFTHIEAPKSFLTKFFFQDKSTPAGIYLYGGVGRGKSLIMRHFFSKLNLKKKFIHYQQLMHHLHIEMHKIENKSTDVVIGMLVSKMLPDINILFIDEFEIKDITDAMLIMRLFDYLIQNNIFIFLTTNIAPDNLYQDGLQRESFLPFIEKIKQNFCVYHIDNHKDYRLEMIASEERIFYTQSKKDSNLHEIFTKLTYGSKPTTKILKIFGREVIFQNTYKNILWTNFQELFVQDFGYGDYVNICQHFAIILVDYVENISETEGDKAMRLINFIDNAYLNHVILFMQFQKPIYEIYPKGKFAKEFLRTTSRLNEMNSKQYFDSSDLK